MNKEEKLLDRTHFLRWILKEYGLTLGGFDPGVLAFDAEGRSYDFNTREWNWLESLLVELHELRKLDMLNKI